MPEYCLRLGSIRFDVCGTFLFAVLTVVAMVATPAVADELPIRPAELNLIPWPKSLTLASGEMKLTADSRIVAANAALAPLAGHL